MLSIWPNLFDFRIIAPLILRVALGLSFLSLSQPSWRSARGILGLLASGFILIGLGAQPAALVAALLLFEDIWSKRHSRTAVLPLMAIALSLLVLGPGLFAFDWPL